MDEGVTGMRRDRPGLRVLLEAARTIDVIICTKFDRLFAGSASWLPLPRSGRSRAIC